jgi:hypothetical protein
MKILRRLIKCVSTGRNWMRERLASCLVGASSGLRGTRPARM